MDPFRSCTSTSISSSRSDILTSDGKRGRYASCVDGASEAENTAKDANLG